MTHLIFNSNYAILDPPSSIFLVLVPKVNVLKLDT